MTWHNSVCLVNISNSCHVCHCQVQLLTSSVELCQKAATEQQKTKSVELLRAAMEKFSFTQKQKTNPHFVSLTRHLRMVVITMKTSWVRWTVAFFRFHCQGVPTDDQQVVACCCVIAGPSTWRSAWASSCLWFSPENTLGYTVCQVTFMVKFWRVFFFSSFTSFWGLLRGNSIGQRSKTHRSETLLWHLWSFYAHFFKLAEIWSLNLTCTSKSRLESTKARFPSSSKASLRHFWAWWKRRNNIQLLLFSCLHSTMASFVTTSE